MTKYRPLKAGETIQSGDEYKNCWAEWDVWVKDRQIMQENSTKAFQDLVKASGWKKIKVREVLEDE